MLEMFRLPGFDDPLGLMHTILGMVALALGANIISQFKGTNRHRRVGHAYVMSMVLLNATAFGLYDLTGTFGPFHAFSLVSLVTLAAGFIPVRRHSPSDWMLKHAIFMCWSYVGLVAAFVSEVVSRLPGVPFAASIAAASVIVVAMGGFLIHSRVHDVVAKT